MDIEIDKGTLCGLSHDLKGKNKMQTQKRRKNPVSLEEEKKPGPWCTLVEPKLMLDVEAADAAAGLSELSAWCRTLHSRVTEDMMV